MRMFFHIGVHKTGSTLIQDNIARNKDALLSQGVYPANELQKEYLFSLRNKLRGLQANPHSPPPADILDDMAKRVISSAVEASAHTILISDENLCGRPFHKQIKAAKMTEKVTLYPDAAPCLQMATHGFKNMETVCLLYTRHQHSLIPSLYSEA